MDTSMSMLHYSRDEQAEPLRALKKLLRMIKQGQFKPDNTRSGYFIHEAAPHDQVPNPSPKAAAAPRAIVHESVTNNTGDTDSSCSVSSSSSESESSHVMSEEEFIANRLDVPVRARKRPKTDQAAVYAVHFRWRTVHMCNSEHPDRLKCGRRLTAVYRTVPSLPTFDYLRCRDCFGNQA